MRSKVSEGKFEAAVLTVDEDLDGNQCIGPDRSRVWVGSAHVGDVMGEEAVSMANTQRK